MAGTGSSALGNLTVVGSTLYFSATVSASGNELWKTDGTPVGTVLVADIVAGAGSSSPTSLVAVGGMLYFSAFESTNGRELWKSDGTAAGTVLVSNINPGTASSSPVIITDVNYNGTAYFNATTAAGGAELWKSDGTGAGTALIADLMAGTISSGPANLTVLGNLLFFTARGPELGSSELFVLQASPSPEIVIEQPVGTNLVDGISAINFGAVAIGSNGTRQFTIRNTGSGNLTVSGITIDGTNPGDFTVTASPTSPVTPSGSTTFTVQFAPAAAGQRAANLHIANSDSDENPFDIALAGFALQTIGPDAFGYVGTSNVAFTFTDISATGTVILDGADDSSVNVPVGFGFSYYGTAYSSVYVSSNVLMTFGASNTAYSNTNLTTTSIGQPAIAVMWDDWVTNASATDKVYYATSGSAGSRVFTVQWDVTPYSGGGEAIVQCQLFEATGQILLNYLDVQTGNSASNGANSTIGIQDTGGNANGRVLQWSFNTASVFDGMSILFSPRDANLSNLLPSSGTLSPAFTSGITTYSESVSNATASIAVTPTALRPNSTIQVRVNGGAYSAVASGASSGSLPLNIGVNSVDVLVTAQDTVTTKLYSIAATRRRSRYNGI